MEKVAIFLVVHAHILANPFTALEKRVADHVAEINSVVRRLLDS